MVFEKIINKAMAGFAKLRSSAFRHWFDWRCRNVLQAPPASINKDGAFVVLTMTCHRDLIQYLVAIKSFTRNATPRKVYVLNDGSLTGRDKETLEKHVPGIEFLAMPDFYSEACPRGGCWERLLAVASLAEQDYVVQMDADTVTSGEIDEVQACVDDGVSFVLSTEPGFRKIEPIRVRNEQVKESQKRELKRGFISTHVQFHAELNFDKLKRFEQLRYVRGCAGFTGFSKGSIDKDFIDEISGEMLDAIGDKWREWGSEQVMSNLVVANAVGTRVLPHPRFSNCSEMDPEQSHFIHFIGMCRFTGLAYTKVATKVIDSLRDKTQ